jgi:hypothetical protein
MANFVKEQILEISNDYSSAEEAGRFAFLEQSHEGQRFVSKSRSL